MRWERRNWVPSIRSVRRDGRRAFEAVAVDLDSSPLGPVGLPGVGHPAAVPPDDAAAVPNPIVMYGQLRAVEVIAPFYPSGRTGLPPGGPPPRGTELGSPAGGSALRRPALVEQIRPSAYVCSGAKTFSDPTCSTRVLGAGVPRIPGSRS
jgi:hypothetical protein